MRGLEVVRRVGLGFPIKKWTVYLGAFVGVTFALLVFATAAAHAGDDEPTAGSSTPSSTVAEIADGASGEVRDGDASGENEAPEPEPATPGAGAREEIPADDVNSVAEESVSGAPTDGAEPASTGKTDDTETVDDAEDRDVAGNEPPADAEPPAVATHPPKLQQLERAEPSPDKAIGGGSAGAGHAGAIDRSGAARAGNEKSDPPAAEDFSSPDAHSEGEHPSRNGAGAPVRESSASGPVTLGGEPDVVPATLGPATFVRTAGPGDEPSSRLPEQAGAIPAQPRAYGAAFAPSAAVACASGMSTLAPTAVLESGGVSKADDQSLSADRLPQLGQPWWSILSWLGPAPPDSPALYSLLYGGEGEMAQPSSSLLAKAIPAGYGHLFAPDLFRGVVAHDQARLRDSPHGVPERPG